MRHLSFPLIYFSNNLLTSVWTLGYLFYTLGINPILHYFILLPIYSSFGCWELFHLDSVSLWQTLINVDIFSTSLLPGTLSTSTFIVSISHPSPKIGHFFWFISFYLHVLQIKNKITFQQNKFPSTQEELYQKEDQYFHTKNFRTLLREIKEINKQRNRVCSYFKDPIL